MRWGFGLRQVSRISLSALSFDALDSPSVDLTARKRDVVPWVLSFFFFFWRFYIFPSLTRMAIDLPRLWSVDL